MIAVDVYVPYLGFTYDFSLDERVNISSLIDEIAVMICLKEQWPIPEVTTELTLFSSEQMRVLHRTSSLYQERISTGQRLILC